MRRAPAAMALLSSLAAVVIVASSAERNHERGLRPPAPPAPAAPFQSWKAVEMEPSMTRPPQGERDEAWGATEGPARRRRPLRKRKRRPQPDDDAPDDDARDEEPRRRDDERPRRRRKKGGDAREDRRSERRPGRLQRPRPADDAGPELSEFDARPHYDRNGDDDEPEPIEALAFENFDVDENKEKSDREVPSAHRNEPETGEVAPAADARQHPPVRGGEDSLAEFSIESSLPERAPDDLRSVDATSTSHKFSEKVTVAYNDVEPRKIERKPLLSLRSESDFTAQKYKDKARRPSRRAAAGELGAAASDAERPTPEGPLDAFKLKELLKKSNGKSLSEILQRNNLSLADLLQGRERALAIFQTEGLLMQNVSKIRSIKAVQYNPDTSFEGVQTTSKLEFNQTADASKESDSQIETTTQTENTTDSSDSNLIEKDVSSARGDAAESEDFPRGAIEVPRKGYLRRRFHGGVRRKLRMRPSSNNTHKGQLSRDLIALTSSKNNDRRNLSKSKEWRGILPSIMTERISTDPNTEISTDSEIITTTPCSLTESTALNGAPDQPLAAINPDSVQTDRVGNEYIANFKASNSEAYTNQKGKLTTTSVVVETESDLEIATEISSTPPIVKPSVVASVLRGQAYNDRLKRKRLRQTTSTSKTPKDLETKETLSIGKFVSASKFVDRTQETSDKFNDEDFTTLEDFLTTESSQNPKLRSKDPKRNRSTPPPRTTVTTEVTAKYEIEEILTDNVTNARLSKVLRERNMTLSELVQQRERGSSRVHLADIFHNASREPFLAKSLLEPISRETYPLRALLEAGAHERAPATGDGDDGDDALPSLFDARDHDDDGASVVAAAVTLHGRARSSGRPPNDEPPAEAPQRIRSGEDSPGAAPPVAPKVRRAPAARDARSATVATASVVGLALVLFLLTYAALRWRRRRAELRAKRAGGCGVPAPVFESRSPAPPPARAWGAARRFP